MAGGWSGRWDLDLGGVTFQTWFTSVPDRLNRARWWVWTPLKARGSAHANHDDDGSIISSHWFQSDQLLP